MQYEEPNFFVYTDQSSADGDGENSGPEDSFSD
jgi:hypothetical protein